MNWLHPTGGTLKSLILRDLLKIFAGLVWVFLIMEPVLAQAQQAFQGIIRYQIEEATGPEDRRVAGYAEIRSNAQRIWVQVLQESEKGSDSGSATMSRTSPTRNSEGAFLLRNDLRDVVLFTGESEAIRVSQSELAALLELVKTYLLTGSSTQQANPGTGSDHVWIRTDEKKRIRGLQAVKWRGRNDDRGEVIDLWLSESYTFDWTFFSGQWRAITSLIDAEGFNVGFFFENGSVPLQADVYQSRALIYRVSAIQVDQEDLSAERLDVPAGVKLLSLSDLMMKMLMGQ